MESPKVKRSWLREFFFDGPWAVTHEGARWKRRAGWRSVHRRIKWRIFGIYKEHRQITHFVVTIGGADYGIATRNFRMYPMTEEGRKLRGAQFQHCCCPQCVPGFVTEPEHALGCMCAKCLAKRQAQSPAPVDH